MIKDLIKLANHLDNKGLTKEADTLDNIIRKMSQQGGGQTHTATKSTAIEFLNKFAPLLGKPGAENLRAKSALQEEYGVDKVAKGKLGDETAYQVYFSAGVKVTVKHSELTIQ